MKKSNKHHTKSNGGAESHEHEAVTPDCDVEDMDSVGGKEEHTEGEQALLAEQKKKYDDLLDKYQRLMAEFDNFRKRSIKEKSSMYDEGIKHVLTKILPVVDNFERALTAADNQEPAQRDEGSFYKGIDMIMRQFYGLFDELGLEVIPALNETFDHNVHFAVAHVEDENYGENVIIDEMQKGYKYKDKVIRASMVRVAN